MRQRLPPLSTLRSFEVAARHGSFKQAALELSVTPTAVSHQIRTLEEYLGVALFERQVRKVVLTEAGARLFPVLRDGFDAFGQVLERLAPPPGRVRVTLSATVAFTARWLVPRIGNFQALHPQIALQLEASDAVIDLAATGIDLAIRYGEGPYPDFDVLPLMTDRFSPVANPSLEIASSADLRRHPLIDFHWHRKHPDNPTWARWFAAANLPEPDEPPLLKFSDESHAIQAAVAGQGIALASLALVGNELAAGQLVQPFEQTLTGFRHHLISRKGESNQAVAAVSDWLIAEARP